jgi:DNA-binding NarL/FixJ family response regulator
MMPALNGLEVANQVRQRCPRTRVVILSMHTDESYVLQALKAGAMAYVLKQSSADELVQAVRNAVSGRRFLSPPISERAIEAYVKMAQETTLDLHETLTSREREVLQLVVEGHTYVEIGERLVISPRTVETHRTNLMRKLDLRSQTDLIRYALKRGIIPLED